MTGIVAFYLLALAMAGAVAFVLPQISPRRYFFAITVPPGFRWSDAGRASVRRYYQWVWASLAVAAAAILAFGASAPEVFSFTTMLPLLGALVGFLRERAVVRRLAPPQAMVQQADLGGDDHLPRWAFLAVPPFALPLAAAAWLRARWDGIPARFPIHWDATGQANRWADKTPHNVYGPLLYGCGMMLFLFFLAIAMFYGSRRSEPRLAMFKMLLASLWLMAILFSRIALSPVAGFPPWWIFATVPIFVVAVLIRSVRLARLPADPTPDSAWILGSIYYNPQDAAVFVQKRIGFGYTFNFGNRMAWAVIAAMTMLLLGLIWLLPR
jgi:uncharacterized membrane protein